MNSSLTFAIVGCGSRGRTYSQIARELGHRIAAISDPDPTALEAMTALAGDPAPRVFSTGEELLAEERLADVAVIATQDAMHFGQAAAALRLGYDVLLEKPAASSLEESEELARLARENERALVVCLVLRHTPFYRTLKHCIDSGQIGEVVSIQASEGVGPWHQAHSFVRGHWSRYDTSAPMIVAKCSHDTDLLAWIADARCTAVSSRAACSYFRPENAPEGATDRCTDPCPHTGTCPFDTHRYLDEHRNWLAMVRPDTDQLDDNAIIDWLKTSNWGRCAYRCDQDTPDHQVVAMQFANGITANLTMTAFDTGRRIRVFGTRGLLEGALHADNREPWIECRLHEGGIEAVPIDEQDTGGYHGHGGGDVGLIEALPSLLANARTKGPDFLEGHRIAFTAAMAVEE